MPEPEGAIEFAAMVVETSAPEPFVAKQMSRAEIIIGAVMIRLEEGASAARIAAISIDIFRLETDTTWTLEVIDHQNTSHVWYDQFESDTEARDVAVKTIEVEGALSFMRGNNVIPFRQG